MIIKKLCLLITTLFYQVLIYAAPPTSQPAKVGVYHIVEPRKSESISDIASNLFRFSQDLDKVLKTISLVTGISVVILGISQYRRYRKNPLETPLSKVVMTILIGLSLIGLYFIPMKYL